MLLRTTTDPQTLFLNRTYFAVVVGLFFGSLIIEKGQDVLLINGLHTPFLDDLFKTVTTLGDGLIFIPILLITLFIRFQYTAVGVLACLAHGILSFIFKRLIFPGMERPRNIIDNDMLYFVPGVDVHGAHSFPSGHTATAFCAAVFVTLLSRNPVLGIASLLLALLVACSRIYLLQHFLMDVAAGAIIGSFTTYVIWQLVESGPKREWMRRKLRFNKSQQQTPSLGG